MNNSKTEHNTLWDLIKDIRFGMLTPRAGGHTRAGGQVHQGWGSDTVLNCKS